MRKGKTNCVLKLEDGCDCNTEDIIYAARCKVDLIYISETQDPLRTRLSRHWYNVKGKPDNFDLEKHCFDYKHDFEKEYGNNSIDTRIQSCSRTEAMQR